MQSALRPFRPIKPGEILQEELDVRGWTQVDLAEILGRPVQAINEIIAGKKAITPDTAVALARALETSPEYWLNLESAYRLDLFCGRRSNEDDIVRRSRLYTVAPVKELMKRRWIDVPNPHDLDRLEQEVCHFLNISSLQEAPCIAFAARKAYREDPPNPSQIAWVCRVKQVAANLNVAKFSKPQLETAIKELPRLSVGELGTRNLPHVLADVGVRFVIVEPLPNTRIDGAAVWLDDKSPVIAVSLRDDRVDSFWFTLMHELAHTLESDGRRMAWLDDTLVGKDAEPTEGKSDLEARADKRAVEWLIPGHAFEGFFLRTRPHFSRHALLSFANEIGVHPAIVVGRLQHMGVVPWTHHRHLLDKIRHVFTIERSTGV